MGRVPQDTGDERLIPEDELLAGLRAGGAEPLFSASSDSCRTSCRRGRWALAAGAERLVERTPGLRRLCAHNVILAAPS